MKRPARNSSKRAGALLALLLLGVTCTGVHVSSWQVEAASSIQELAGKGALLLAKGAATRAAVTKSGAAVTKSAHGHDQKTVAAILIHGGKLHKVPAAKRAIMYKAILPKELWKLVRARREQRARIKKRLLKTDPAGSIASWDWGKSEQGGFYHDRSEDAFLDGKRHGNGLAGNEFGFTKIDNSDDYLRRGAAVPIAHIGPMAGAF